MLLLDIAFRSERDVLATEFPHLGFELLLLRLANAQGLLSVEALEAGDALAVRPASLPASRPAAAPAATFSRKSSPVVDAPVSAIVPPVLWDAVRRNLEGRKKTVLLGLLSQMRGEMQGDEFVVTCGHEMMLDRLKEKDKWQPLLAALEEAAGRAVPVRLSVSTEKKSPEPDGIAPGDAVLELLRTFEGSMLVKVQPAPADEVPRNEAAADEDAGETEFPEPVEEGG